MNSTTAMKLAIPPMTTRAYIEYWFMAISFIVTTATHLHFCYYYINQKNRLSITIFINLVTWILCTVPGGFLYLYLLLSDVRLGSVIYYSGMVFNSSVFAVSGSVTMLLIDRIFVFLAPFKYKIYRRRFIFISIGFCAICFLYQFRLVFISEADLTLGNGCTSLICVFRLFSYYSFNMRVPVGCINIVLAIVFEIMMCKYTANSHLHQAQFKKVTILTIANSSTEIFCNCVPNILTAMASYVNLPIYQYLGSSYISILIAVEALSSSLIFGLVMYKPMKAGNSQTTGVIVISYKSESRYNNSIITHR